MKTEVQEMLPFSSKATELKEFCHLAKNGCEYKCSYECALLPTCQGTYEGESKSALFDEAGVRLSIRQIAKRKLSEVLFSETN